MVTWSPKARQAIINKLQYAKYESAPRRAEQPKSMSVQHLLCGSHRMFACARKQEGHGQLER